MRWLSLLPEELEPGDLVFGSFIESIEPVESSEHILIVFEDGTDKVWPWRAPVRAGRPEGPIYMEDVPVNREIL